MTMKACKSFTMIPLLVMLLASGIFAQGMSRPDKMGQGNRFGNLLFDHMVYNYADEQGEKSIFDFNYTLVNDLLTFIKTDDDWYHASYDLNLIIYDQRKNPLLERSVHDDVSVQYFEETNSRRSPKQGNIKLSLPPGEYYYMVNLVENEIPRVLAPMTRIKLRDFTPDRLHSSDIIFVDSLNTEQDSLHFFPNINGAFSSKRSAYMALIYLYPPQDARSISINYTIENTGGFTLATFDTTYALNNLITIPFFINFKDLNTKPGRYVLTFIVSSNDQKIKLQKHFSIQWNNTPLEENNIDLAIEQIKLIANRKSVEKLRDASEEEKKEFYEKFWKQRDPTPETPENELEDEFMTRINFCNQNFIESHSNRGGWNSDRGHVYIKYGPPTRVERQQADINSPAIEIWYYSGIDRVYYFADRDGNGTFRLVKIE